MAAVNYYLGLKRGAPFNVNKVTYGTATAGTAVDVEVRIQINDGTSATKINRLEVIKAIEIIEGAIVSAGLNHAGANLPIP